MAQELHSTGFGNRRFKSARGNRPGRWIRYNRARRDVRRQVESDVPIQTKVVAKVADVVASTLQGEITDEASPISHPLSLEIENPFGVTRDANDHRRVGRCIDVAATCAIRWLT